MKSVFVTGASGFLGRHMVRHFQELGAEVSGTVSCEAEASDDTGGGLRLRECHRVALPDPDLGKWIARSGAELVIHCAGRASVPLSMARPAEDFESNTRVAFEVLEACRASGFSGAVLLMSSAAVYGNPESMPVDESAPVRPLSAYGYHKRQAELLFEEYARVFGLKTAVLRIFSAYGAGLQRQVLWDLSRKILDRTSGPGPILLQGTGEETRDFIHARDVARAAACIAGRGELGGEVYNVASGEEMPIRSLAELLCECFGVDRECRGTGSLPEGVPGRWLADIGKLRSLGYEASVEFGEGLTEFAAWAKATVTRTLKP